MKRPLLLACGLLLCSLLKGQSFEISDRLESYKGYIGEVIKAPVQFKNTTHKVITLIIRKADAQIGTTQKSFLCPNGTCLGADQAPEDFIVKVEPGETIQNFAVALEAGLVPGPSRVKYLVYNKSNPTDNQEIEVNFLVEELAKVDMYTSRFITIHDVYPNPVTEFATINYKLHDERVSAKIVIHNILGNRLDEHELPYLETQVKIRADELSGGIYFYTVYIDNEGVMTRKLIVKR